MCTCVRRGYVVVGYLCIQVEAGEAVHWSPAPPLSTVYPGAGNLSGARLVTGKPHWLRLTLPLRRDPSWYLGSFLPESQGSELSLHACAASTQTR